MLKEEHIIEEQRRVTRNEDEREMVKNMKGRRQKRRKTEELVVEN
jgi:hypothetical protein